MTGDESSEVNLGAIDSELEVGDPLDLKQEVIPEVVPWANDANSETSEFNIAAQQAELQLKNEGTKIDHEERLQNMSARNSYAKLIFCLLCVWVISIMITIWCSGISYCCLEVPDNVLIALVSGVSASIIGLFTIVARNLFPS